MKKETTISKRIKYYLREMNKVFVNEIMKERFTILTIKESVIDLTLTVDGNYRFCIFYHSSDSLSMLETSTNTLMLQFTDEQKAKLFELFKKLLNDHQNHPKNIAIRKAEFLKLKDEFEPIINECKVPKLGGQQL